MATAECVDLKVEVSISIRIKNPVDVITERFRVTAGKYFFEERMHMSLCEPTCAHNTNYN